MDKKRVQWYVQKKSELFPVRLRNMCMFNSLLLPKSYRHDKKGYMFKDRLSTKCLVMFNGDFG